VGPDLQAVRVAADVYGDLGFYAMDGEVPARPDLSPQENDVLRSIADGISARELAETMYIRERSTQFLITEIYPRLSRHPDADEDRREWGEEP
jgi:DNA-binding NarL/FixJ family response regulator